MSGNETVLSEIKCLESISIIFDRIESFLLPLSRYMGKKIKLPLDRILLILSSLFLFTKAILHIAGNMSSVIGGKKPYNPNSLIT